MSIVEGIGQYQNNTAANTQTMSAVKETIRPSSVYTQELTPGKVFEGTVLEIKDGQVTIGLSNGQTITARLEAGINLEKGMPMLFEVKTNSGEQIAIRPMNWESMQNPTLLKALEAAGLKVNQQNLSMVSEMMKEQMPVDKTSLMQMVRMIASFPETDVQTLIQMQKAGIEINKDSIQQFENYRNNQQSFLPEIKDLMENIPQMAEQIYGGEAGNVSIYGQSSINTNITTLLGFQQQIVGILMGGQTGAETSQAAAAAQTEAVVGQAVQEALQQNLSVARVNETEGAVTQQNLAFGEHGVDQQEGNGNLKENTLGEGSQGKHLSQQSEIVEGNRPSNNGGEVRNVNDILTPKQQANLTELLKEFPAAVKNEVLLQNGQLNPKLTAGELLQQIVTSVGSGENFTSEAMQKLFCSNEYKEVLKKAIQEQWLTTPEQMKEEGAVKELYQRLGKQMEQLQQVLNQTGTQQGAALAKSAQGVQSNLEFMNQLNQIYTYVQLPLKLRNQNAHSDLYVYTNKKSLHEKDGELTALLHLDMEHLGATDIYIKMQGRAVETTFYLEDKHSYQLIENHIDTLQEKLEVKGYQCRIEVENREKQQDFVEDFLEKEKTVGKFLKYSFDVKA